MPIGRHASKRASMIVHCYTTTSSAKKNSVGDAESLLALTPFMLPVFFLCFCYVLDVISLTLSGNVIRVLFNPE
jgi:hypothetical protein